MTVIRPEREAWVAEAKKKDVLEVAREVGAAKLVRQGHEHVGPCPFCGGEDRFSVNQKKGAAFCRHCGTYDAIALIQHGKGYDFDGAVEWLTGRSAPGKEAKITDAERRAIPETKAPSEEDQKADRNRYLAREIKKAGKIWEAGKPIGGTPAETYLAARGFERLPAGFELRYAPEQPYWADIPDPDAAAQEGKPPKTMKDVIHRGPALLGKITDDRGELVGCHITWLDPARPGKKAVLPNPLEKGETLPAKKLRGTKRRGAEKITDPDGATRLVIGEGRETVLAIWLAEAGTEAEARTAYWSAIDLGHLAGKAVAHPTEKTKSGRAKRVPGPEPKPSPEADLAIPDRFTEIILLRDGDSDPFATELAMIRAAKRMVKPGRVIRRYAAPAGQDHNDMLFEDGKEAA